MRDFDRLEPLLHPTKLKPGQCPHCFGLGTILDSIDDAKEDVRVPCYFCQVFCKSCKRHVRKPHTCPALV